MLVAGEVKGELARIQPSRACCRRAELAGLLYRDGGSLSTLDPATARVAMRLAGGTPAGDHSGGHARLTARAGARHHLRIGPAPASTPDWHWEQAAACDHRAFIRGVVLGAGSLSFSTGGPHVEFVFVRADHARQLRSRLVACGVRARHLRRRGRHVVYLKGQDEVASLLRLSGANRALLDFETARVGRDVQNRLNRVLNAEGANVARTVRAAALQLSAIRRLDATGRLRELSSDLRATAAARREEPDADLGRLAARLGIGRSAVNHRLRRLVGLAAANDGHGGEAPD